MKQEFKLLRLSNGEQIIAKVVDKTDTSVHLDDMFRLYQRESYDGVATGITKWLTFISDETVELNLDHVSFITNIENDIKEYLEKKSQESDDEDRYEAAEQEFKSIMSEYLINANTYSTIH